VTTCQLTSLHHLRVTDAAEVRPDQQDQEGCWLLALGHHAARLGSPRHVETVDSLKAIHRLDHVLVVGAHSGGAHRGASQSVLNPPGSTIVTLMPSGFTSDVQHLGEPFDRKLCCLVRRPFLAYHLLARLLMRTGGNDPNAVGGIWEALPL
jgi:hypothetical protein